MTSSFLCRSRVISSWSALMHSLSNYHSTWWHSASLAASTGNRGRLNAYRKASGYEKIFIFHSVPAFKRAAFHCRGFAASQMEIRVRHDWRSISLRWRVLPHNTLCSTSNRVTQTEYGGDAGASRFAPDDVSNARSSLKDARRLWVNPGCPSVVKSRTSVSDRTVVRTFGHFVVVPNRNRLLRVFMWTPAKPFPVLKLHSSNK